MNRIIRRTPVLPKGDKPNKYFAAESLAVKIYPDGREVCQDNAEGKRKYSQATEKMSIRQWEVCAICGLPFAPWLQPTFDHQDGRGMNGSIRDDRIWINGDWHNAALCVPCQGIKGSKRYHWQDGKYVPKVGL